MCPFRGRRSAILALLGWGGGSRRSNSSPFFVCFKCGSLGGGG